MLDIQNMKVIYRNKNEKSYYKYRLIGCLLLTLILFAKINKNWAIESIAW
jgi:hypothetical protein